MDKMKKEIKKKDTRFKKNELRTIEIATMGGYASSRSLDAETSKYMTICREVKRYVKKHEKTAKQKTNSRIKRK